MFAIIIGYILISCFSFPFERFSHNIFILLIASIVAANQGLSEMRFLNKFRVILSFFLIISIYTCFVAVIRLKGDFHTKNALDHLDNNKYELAIIEINKAYNHLYFDIDNTSTPILYYRGMSNYYLGNYCLALVDLLFAHI